MLLRHTGIYLLARLLTGAAGFAGLAIFTRLLDPSQFGRLTLTLTGLSFLSLVFATGPNLALQRFLPEHGQAARASAFWIFILPAAGLGALAVAVLVNIAGSPWDALWIVLAPLLVLMVLHEFQIATAQSQLSPWRYAWLGTAKVWIGTLIGVALVFTGFGIEGVLWGAAIGLVIALAANIRGWAISWRFVDWELVQRTAIYGLPLSAAAAVNWIGAFSDRWLLAFYWNVESAGRYAVAYDLVYQSLLLPASVVALAADPLAIAKYAGGDIAGTRHQLRQSGALLAALLLPSFAGLLLTGPALVNLLVGESYRASALALFPVLVPAIFINCLTYYPIAACKLSSRTDIAFFSIAATAASNIIFNILLIPAYQDLGAAISTLLAHLVGLGVLCVWVMRIFPLPLPDRTALGAALTGTVAMAAWLWPFRQETQPGLFFGVFVVALIIYASVFISFFRLKRKPVASLFSWDERAQSDETRA